MPPSGMLRRVALARTDVLEECTASVIRVTRIGELGTTLAATSNSSTLRRKKKSGFSFFAACFGCQFLSTFLVRRLSPDDGGDTFSERPVLTRATRRHIPEDDILLQRLRLKYRVEDFHPSGWCAVLFADRLSLILVSPASFSALKMEAICFTET
jgi:hypothetical protein